MKVSSITTFLLFLVSVALLTGCESENIETPEAVIPSVKVLTIQSTENSDMRSFPGKVIASTTTNIGSKVGGQVMNINVQPGDKVKTGDVLLALDPVDYQLQYDQATANFQLAELTFDRVKKSFQQKIGSQADFDKSKINLDLAKVGLQQAKNQLENTQIKAPHDGLVIKKHISEYEFIQVAKPLVTIQTQNSIDIKFQIPSDIAAQLEERQEGREQYQIEVEFKVLPGEVFYATAKEFSASSDTSTRAFNAILTMPVPQHIDVNLLPGMDANVLVDLALINSAPIMTIPVHSVVNEQSGAYVWLLNKETVVKTHVTLGAISGNSIEIKSGLKQGDVLVTAGVHRLVDQQTVSVWRGE